MQGEHVSRAKFTCESVQQTRYSDAKNYTFQAVPADEIEENKRYHKYSPSGNLSITVDNPAVTFELGKSYYIDFVEAAE